MRCLKTAVLAGALGIISTASPALEAPPHFTNDQLMSMCRAKRGTVAKCECMLKVYRTVKPTDEMNMLFWKMYDDPARATVYIKERARTERGWAKAFGQRADLLIGTITKDCSNVF